MTETTPQEQLLCPQQSAHPTSEHKSTTGTHLDGSQGDPSCQSSRGVEGRHAQIGVPIGFREACTARGLRLYQARPGLAS